MKVLLVDADSTIPNIALMKLSAWHKFLGDDVELVRANLPYYPNRKKSRLLYQVLIKFIALSYLQVIKILSLETILYLVGLELIW